MTKGPGPKIVPLPRRTARPDVIKGIESFLSLARKGRVVDMVLLGTTPEGEIYRFTDVKENFLLMVAATEIAKARLIERTKSIQVDSKESEDGPEETPEV